MVTAVYTFVIRVFLIPGGLSQTRVRSWCDGMKLFFSCILPTIGLILHSWVLCFVSVVPLLMLVSKTPPFAWFNLVVGESSSCRPSSAPAPP